ncbi:SDR family NAD(P)-dependent oxidoreductase [Candidatus Falkowbacteria bacterium]|nr:SDR family NAD(P)-dependent oxidoreductase [Candidatus Falkowbacteria bacterium]
MKSRNKKVLVTGGAGFVGSAVCRELLRKGYFVVVLDNLSRGFKSAVPKGAQFIKGDLRNKNDVNKALKGVDCVIHCAAKLVIPESFSNPVEFLEVNVLGTLNLLNAMHEKKIKNLVFSSTAGVYSEKTKSPIKEYYEKIPYSPYGGSKLAMELIMHAYYLASGLNVTILRYFNPYGPGYFIDPPQHAVPMFFTKALAHQPIPVYGDGLMERDYIYIDDLASVHVKAMMQKGFKVYNVGGGRGVSIIEIVQEIIKVTKSKSEIKHVTTPPGYPARMFADISKIKKEIGWSPKVSLNAGIKKTYDLFYKNYKKAKQPR